MGMESPEEGPSEQAARAGWPPDASGRALWRMGWRATLGPPRPDSLCDAPKQVRRGSVRYRDHRQPTGVCPGRRYNTSWLIQRHGHLTPKEAYRKAQKRQQRHDQVGTTSVQE